MRQTVGDGGSSVGLRCKFRTIPPRCLPRWTSGVRVRGVDGLAASNSGPSHRLSQDVSGEAPMLAASDLHQNPTHPSSLPRGWLAIVLYPHPPPLRKDPTVWCKQDAVCVLCISASPTKHSTAGVYRRRYMPWSHVPLPTRNDAAGPTPLRCIAYGGPLSADCTYPNRWINRLRLRHPAL